MIKYRAGCQVGLAVLLTLVSSQAHARINPIINAEDTRQVDSPVLVAASHSPKASDRAAAATAYGRIQKPAGIDPLLGLLSDTNPQVEQAAIFALGQLGWDASFAAGRELEIVTHLVPFLKNRNPALRVRALEAIGKLALESTDSIAGPSLSDPNASVRAEAATALYRARLLQRTKNPSAPIADLSAETLASLLSLAKDPHAAVRRSVAYLFIATKDPRALDTLLTLTRDSDVYVRFFTADALRLADSHAAPAILVLAQDHSYVVRVAALQTLAKIGAVAALPAGLQASLSKDSVYHVRAALADAYSTLADPSQALELQTLRSDSSTTVRVEALKTWVHLHKDLEAVQTALGDSNWVIREGAVEAAQDLGAIAEKSLLSAAHDPDVRVRFPAVSELGGIPTQAAFDAISAALFSDQFSERFTAVDAIATRKEPAAPALLWQSYQRSLADSPSKWMGVREEIIGQLANFPADVVTQELKQALADPDSSAVKIALHALQARGVTNLPPLPEESLSFSPYRDLRFKRDPRVILETTRGRIVIECYAKSAPIHVANFVGFARSGGYDGLPWHRVVSDFVIQGGDPDRTGFGDAGYALRAEINPARYRRGSVGMPRSDDFGTGGVQLFITHVSTPSLDGRYTVFGQVIEGLSAVDRIEVGDLILRASVLE